MVQQKKEDNGKKLSTPTTKDSQGENEMSKKGKVTVISLIAYANSHANPLIVIKNESFQHLGFVTYKEKCELDKDEECTLRFLTNYLDARYSQCKVSPGDIVYLTYDKMMDCVNPIIVHEGEKSEKIDTIKKRIKNYGFFVKLRRGTLGVACLLFALYLLIDFSGVLSSSSSSNNTTTTTTTFTTRLDVLHFLEGESIYTPLGNLYISNGKAYDDSGSFVNDVIVDSYTANSAVIEIYPAQWSGYSMKFNVDKLTGDIYRIDK